MGICTNCTNIFFFVEICGTTKIKLSTLSTKKVGENVDYFWQKKNRRFVKKS